MSNLKYLLQNTTYDILEEDCINRIIDELKRK